MTQYSPNLFDLLIIPTWMVLIEEIIDSFLVNSFSTYFLLLAQIFLNLGTLATVENRGFVQLCQTIRDAFVAQFALLVPIWQPRPVY